MNTAQHRTAAQNAEEVRDYAAAALHYEQAVANYPRNSSGEYGALALRDINGMTLQAADCRRAARESA